MLSEKLSVGQTAITTDERSLELAVVNISLAITQHRECSKKDEKCEILISG